jgi:ElaB/YqjD/DUF883 family membrane-anchored ribosome-binding protein
MRSFLGMLPGNIPIYFEWSLIMKSHTNHGGASLAETAGERAKQYVDMGVDAYNSASGQVRTMTRRVDGFVREKPWAIIGAAAGIGLLVGLMIRRK